VALGQAINGDEKDMPRFFVEEVRELIPYLRPEFSQERLKLRRSVKASYIFVIWVPS